MGDYYKLVDGKPEPCGLEGLSEQFRDQDSRRVGFDRVGDVDVSTVFLAIDHAFGGGPPVLFETMVFGGPLDQEQVRYHTIEEARAGHAAMVARVKAAAEGA